MPWGILPVVVFFGLSDALECFASGLHCLQRVILCQGFYTVTELLSCLKIPLRALPERHKCAQRLALRQEVDTCCMCLFVIFTCSATLS